MQILLMCVLFVVGACVGSFVCCQARRLYIRTSAKGKNLKMSPRSVCMKCHYQLKWYDNIPVVSWLCLKGKCRKCNSKIGVAEVLSEVGVGLGFVCAGLTIEVDTASALEWWGMCVNLGLISVLAFLAVYDGLYGQLPVRYLIISIICAVVLAAIRGWGWYIAGSFSVGSILGVVWSVMILGGLYLVLYLVSKGRWVGDGDWLLGTAIGLALGKPMLALVALFVANALACVVMMPMLGKTKNRRIHFGPFMVVAYVIVVALAGAIEEVMP